MSALRPREFLRAVLADASALPPGAVGRVRMTVRTGESIPAQATLIIQSLLVITLEAPIAGVPLMTLRQNRVAREQEIRTILNTFFGAEDDPDPLMRRNLRFNGMLIEQRGAATFLRVVFSGRSAPPLQPTSTAASGMVGLGSQPAGLDGLGADEVLRLASATSDSRQPIAQLRLWLNAVLPPPPVVVWTRHVFNPLSPLELPPAAPPP